MIAIERIVCPIDFSDASQHAMDHAVAIARWYKARVVALHVYNPINVPIPDYDVVGAGAVWAPPLPDLAQIEADVVTCLGRATRAGLKTEAVITRGPVTQGILECAASERADLIVMGTHGAGGFEHLLLGSTTEKVLRKARCPVLTIPPRAHATSMLPYKRVLCPVDFSDPSAAALELALSLVHEAGAALTLLHVVEWPSDEEPIALRSFNVPEYTRYREEDAKTRLDALIAASALGECRPETRIARGKPYREILRVADDERSDLIVMGVHGRNVLESMLFGSTTNQVVRRATCPVLTLRN